METAVLTALITGACSVIAVIITNINSNKQIDVKLDKQMAVIEERLKHLTDTVNKHNEVVTRTYVLEAEVREIKNKLK